VIAFLVSSRIKEIGIRMALGATQGVVMRRVLRSGLGVSLAGIMTGVAGAFGVTKYFSIFLDRVNPRDPLIFSGVALLLCAAGLVACCVPARRAARVDAVITLRYE
jgi:ABC-type antimicrobial peptide transport system permease subunit